MFFSVFACGYNMFVVVCVVSFACTHVCVFPVTCVRMEIAQCV